jgi:hypothetical protein
MSSPIALFFNIAQLLWILIELRRHVPMEPELEKAVFRPDTGESKIAIIGHQQTLEISLAAKEYFIAQ